MSDDIEVLLDVGISVREVSPDLHPRQMVFRGFVQARCQLVCLGPASGSEAAPAPCIEPILAVSSGVDVNRDEDYLVFAQLLADLIDTTAALLQGDVFALRNEDLDIKSNSIKALVDEKGEVAVVCVFAEVAVRATFTRRIKAMAIVEKNLHSCRLGSDGKLKILCGNTYFPEIPLTL